MITKTLFGFFVDQKNDSLAADTKAAAQAFINSPAYAVLLSEAAIGQTPAVGDEQIYLAMQRLIFRLNEMAGMDVADVMAQAAALQFQQTYELGAL